MMRLNAADAARALVGISDAPLWIKEENAIGQGINQVSAFEEVSPDDEESGPIRCEGGAMPSVWSVSKMALLLIDQ